MPATYQIDLTQHLMVSRFDGKVPLADAWALLNTELTDERFDQVAYHLVDVRTLRGPGASRNAFETLIRRQRSRLAGHPAGAKFRTAIVVQRMVDLGLGRMFQTMATGIGPVEVFSDVESACAWLGVAPPKELLKP
jgi:hypothetical protein